MAKTVGSLLIKLGLNDTGFTKGLKRSSKQVSTFSSKMNKMALKVSKAFAAIGVAAIGIGTRVAKSAIAYEQLTVTFGALTGSAAKAKKVLQDLDKLNLETPFTQDTINQGAQTLLNFGLEQEKLIPTMRMLGNLAKGNSADFQKLAEVYGQSRAEGKLLSKDIRQFVGANIPILKLLSDELGVAENQIFDLASKGKIHFSDLEKAFQGATSEGGQFFGLMARQSQTAGGLFSTLESAVSVFFRQLGQFLLPALKEAAAGLIVIMQNLVTKMNSADTSFGLKLAAGIAAAFDVMDGFFEMIKNNLGLLRGVVHTFQAMFAPIVDGFSKKSFLEFAKHTAKAGEAFNDFGQAIKSAFTGGISGDFMDAYATNMERIRDAAKDATPFVGNVGPSNMTGGPGPGGSTDFMPGFGDIAPSAFSLSSNGKDFLGEHIEKLRTAREAISQLAAGYRDEFVPALFEASDGVEPIVNNLSKWLDKTAEQQQTIISAATQIGTAFSGAFEAAVKGGKAFGDFMKQMLLDLIKRLLKAALISAALSILTGGGDAFKNALGKLGGFKALMGLAKGGLAYGPTAAIVGDNPNAKSDPEVIAPLSKLKGILSSSAGNMRGGFGGFVLRGRDLHTAVSMVQQDNARSGGNRIVLG